MPIPTLVQTQSGNFIAVGGMTPYTPHAPTCDVCLQHGHSYKNCTHSCIADIHQHTINLFVEYTIISADTIHTRPTRTLWNTRNQFVATLLPPALKRALLVKYTPQENKNYTYTSAASWRDRPTEENTHIPSRIGLISRASNTFLSELIILLYDILSSNFLANNPQSTERFRQESNRFASQLFGDIISIRDQVRYCVPQEGEELINALQSMRDLAASGLNEYNNTVEPTRPTEHNTLAVDYTNYHNNTWLADIVQELCPAAIPTIPTIQEEITPSRPRNPTPARINAFETELTYHTISTDDNAADNSVTSNNEEPHSCGICWDTITTTNKCTTQCNHKFCTSCITQQAITAKNALIRTRGYIRRNERTPVLTCAMCRTTVINLTVDPEAHEDDILKLKLALYSTAVQGQLQNSVAVTPPPQTPQTPQTPPRPNTFPNIDDDLDTLQAEFQNTMLLLDELNSATDNTETNEWAAVTP